MLLRTADVYVGMRTRVLFLKPSHQLYWPPCSLWLLYRQWCAQVLSYLCVHLSCFHESCSMSKPISTLGGAQRLVCKPWTRHPPWSQTAEVQQAPDREQSAPSQAPISWKAAFSQWYEQFTQTLVNLFYISVLTSGQSLLLTVPQRWGESLLHKVSFMWRENLSSVPVAAVFVRHGVVILVVPAGF